MKRVPYIKVLDNWDCRYDLKSKGAVVFEAFYSALRHLVFANQNNSFGDKVGRYLTCETGIFIDFYQQFDDILLNQHSAWYEECHSISLFYECLFSY